MVLSVRYRLTGSWIRGEGLLFKPGVRNEGLQSIVCITQQCLISQLYIHLISNQTKSGEINFIVIG